MVTGLLIPSCLNPPVFSHRMKNKLDVITMTLKELVEQKNLLGLRDNIPTAEAEKLPTTSLVDESSVQGRDNDKEAVRHLVLDDSETSGGRVGIIPIVGMGGVGKTTLAQLVYNDTKLKNHFDLKAWVCVSEEFDVFKLTKIIFQSVTGESGDDLKDLNLLQVALRERLSNKKFLIVLDDVWNENHDKWELLQLPFQVGLAGSKIVVTTRNDKVVSTMRCGQPYRLMLRSHADSISLFAQNSLGVQNFDGYPSFKTIGEDLVKKCGGLPLALKTLGRLLYTKERVEVWEELLNSEIWDLPERKSGILPALRLSYFHLPPDLKQLFAYCSLFPKDYQFNKDELVLLWMAEGFLHDSRQRMEDLGLEYFNELLSRSFFQHSGDDESLYVMHDLMNDLAQFVAGEFFHRLEDEKQIGRKQSFGGRCHHASFIRQECEASSNFQNFHRAKGLRTFLPLPVQRSEEWRTFYIPNMILVDLLPRLQCLRVLSLSGYSIKDLPDSVRDMKHLRYLNLSGTGIECLPKWVGDLYNLQTLLLIGCKELARLPINFGHLINLRHINLTDTPKLEETPLGIGKLTTLQTLSKLSLGKNNGSQVRELKDLSDLRGTISIMGLHHVTSIHDAKAANLTGKQGLDDLEMGWSDTFDGSRNEVRGKEVLDALKPHTNLKRLRVRFYSGIDWPSWVGDQSFSHVGEVRLAGCRKCTSLPSLGQLPLLKKLFIKDAEGVKIVGSGFYGVSSGGQHVAYPSLEVLEFEQMKNWEEWSTENGVTVFPCLRELRMSGCPKLVSVSLPQLPSLQWLYIEGCSEVALANISLLPSLQWLAIRVGNMASISVLPSLQRLHISGCSEVALESILSVAASITTLKLDCIVGLTQLHDQLVRGVVDLEIYGCRQLKYLWRRRGSEATEFQGHARVKRLRVKSCEQLVSLVEGEQVLPCINLEELEIERCRNLVKLPNLGKCLKKLRVSECEKLVSLVEGKGEEQVLSHNLEELALFDCENLVTLPPKWRNNLKELKISECPKLEWEGTATPGEESSSKEILEEETSQLESLHIVKCPTLTSLIPITGTKLPTTLKRLSVCESNIEVEEECNWLLANNSSLEDIYFFVWRKLKSFPKGFGFKSFIHLTTLSIRNCKGLERFPERGGLPPCLRYLSILGCSNLKSLPVDEQREWEWATLTSLQTLRIVNCPRLECSFPCGVWPPNLKSLALGNIGKPFTEGWGLHNAPPSLVLLSLLGDGLPGEVVSFSTSASGPDFLLPPSLTLLELVNMEKLETLSTGLQNLTSLRFLGITGCPKLASLPEMLLPMLQGLEIGYNCPILKKRCRKDKKDYWSLISHIPCR